MGESMKQLKKMLCAELDTIAETGNISRSDLDTVHKLTDTIKNIDKIEMYEGSGYSEEGWSNTDGYGRRNYSRDEENYSRDGYSRDGGRGEGYSYDGQGNSYARRGMHYVRGHYSRAEEGMMDKIEDMINEGNLSMEEKNTLKRAMKILGK